MYDAGTELAQSVQVLQVLYGYKYLKFLMFFGVFKKWSITFGLCEMSLCDGVTAGIIVTRY